jgi:Hint domain
VFDLKRSVFPGLARRHFLAVSAAVAARIAAVGAVGLPILASGSKPAKADHDHDEHDHDEHEHHHPHCFLIGTRILTPCGEVPVEELTIGALVETLNGPLPIKWIGRHRFRKVASSSWHSSVAPIRVARFALHDQYPHRDLYLSPGHSLFFDGVLIPVKLLVNDRSVVPAKMDDCEVIEYFQIELETHEAVFAEGAPAETLLTTNREGFANFVEYERLYGSEERPARKPFAPVIFGYGGRAELQGLLRLALSPIVDVRDPVQRARARIETRAELVKV